MSLDRNIYCVLEEWNKKGLCTGLGHWLTSLYCTLGKSIIPDWFILREDSVCLGEHLPNNELYLLAMLSYNSHLTDEKVLHLLGHDKLINRDSFDDEIDQANLLVTQKGTCRYIGFRGLDLRNPKALCAIGSPYYTDMRKYGMKGKVSSSFVLKMFKNGEFHKKVVPETCSCVYLSGHSMGACIAIVAGVYIATMRPDVQVEVYGLAPLVFYNDEFLQYAQSLPNIKYTLRLLENDMIVMWYNSIRLTDKSKYRDFELSDKCIPYTDSSGDIRHKVFTDLRLSKVLNPKFYERHFVENYALTK